MHPGELFDFHLVVLFAVRGELGVDRGEESRGYLSVSNTLAIQP